MWNPHPKQKEFLKSKEKRVFYSGGFPAGNSYMWIWKLLRGERMPIDKPFAYHKPSDDGFLKITRLREAYSEMKSIIEETCPDSRQKSVAITELETSAMWAIKAVVFNDPNSEVDPT